MPTHLYCVVETPELHLVALVKYLLVFVLQQTPEVQQFLMVVYLQLPPEQESEVQALLSLQTLPVP